MTTTNASSEERQRNWAGNLLYGTNNVAYPESVAEMQALVSSCRKLRVLGSRHSFNRIADSDEQLLSMQQMNKLVAFDKTNATVTVEGGMRYGELALLLQQNGYALPNLASLPHITVAGACATATHGSGVKNKSLASAVSAVEFVRANGDIVSLSRDRDQELFNGAVVHLGALALVSKLTLDLVPSFDVRQTVYLDLPMTVLENHFEEIMSSAYSVSLFTDWASGTIGEVWLKQTTTKFDAKPVDFFGAQPAREPVHPIAGEAAQNVTEQMGVTGPWYERLPHFKMGFKPSAGAELQSEYFVAFEDAYPALKALQKLGGRIKPFLLISEIRTIAADDFWLSPFYQRPSVAFHFTWKQLPDDIINLLPAIEAALSPFAPRPHWGKLFTLSPFALQQQYKKLFHFRELMQEFDPSGKFRNEFIDRSLF